MGLELSQKSTGEYLRWIISDIIKEEHDTIVANQIDSKKLSSTISSTARQWFFNYLAQSNEKEIKKETP